MTTVPRLTRITIYPIKSLDGVDVDQSRIVERGALEFDRAWAIFGENDKWLRAKTTPALHQLRSTFNSDFSHVTVTDQRDDSSGTFNLSRDIDQLEVFLSRALQQPVHVRHRIGGFPDDREITGPTVTSIGTLREVASWFEGLTAEDLHRRMRTNLVLDSEEPFFEDRLIRDPEHVYAFAIGDTTLEAVSPTGRCAVPTRDPVTGEKFADFQKIFMRQREATFTKGIPGDARFDHMFYLTIRTRTPTTQTGKTIAVGDAYSAIGDLPI